MSFYEWNNCSTSATNPSFEMGSTSTRQRVWQLPEKRCGGTTKCGLPCHKSMFCTVVDSYKDNKKTVYKYYCRKCKIYGEGSSEGCE